MKRTLLISAILISGMAGATACEPTAEPPSRKQSQGKPSSEFIQSSPQYCVALGSPLITSQVPFLMDLVAAFSGDENAEGVANSGNKLADASAEVADEMSQVTKPGSGVSKNVRQSGVQLIGALESLGRANLRAYSAADLNVMTNKIERLSGAVSDFTDACESATSSKEN